MSFDKTLDVYAILDRPFAIAAFGDRAADALAARARLGPVARDLSWRPGGARRRLATWWAVLRSRSCGFALAPGQSDRLGVSHRLRGTR